jgi:hypothetical protein
MGYDRKLCADVLGAFITSLRRSVRRSVEDVLSVRSPSSRAPTSRARWRVACRWPRPGSGRSIGSVNHR